MYNNNNLSPIDLYNNLEDKGKGIRGRNNKMTPTRPRLSNQ